MKNKGYTLFELMLVVALIAVLSGIVGLSMSKYSEQKDKSLVTEKLHTYFEMMALEAYTTHESIDVKFDFDNNLILFEKKGKMIMKVDLPKRYNYSANGTNIHFTENGNISPMFTFEVKENNIGFFQLTFVSTSKFVKDVRINKKIPKGNAWVKVE